MKRPRIALRRRNAKPTEPETVVPLDAEDLVLASLEARVRSEESRVNLDSPGPLASLTVRIPRAVISRVRAQAAERKISTSKLIELALVDFLSQEKGSVRDKSRK